MCKAYIFLEISTIIFLNHLRKKPQAFFLRLFRAAEHLFIRFAKRDGVGGLVFGAVEAVCAADQFFEAFGAAQNRIGVVVENFVAFDAVARKFGDGGD